MQRKREKTMVRILLPIVAVGFVAVMGYAVYLQAQIWHLL
jgi:nitrate reductase NapE component